MHSVSLYRNAAYVMIGTAVTSITGFVFWIIAARLYPVEAVGVGAAIIAATGLLALFSELGLGIGLIRFLPGAGKDGSSMINTCFTLTGIASVAIVSVFLAGLHLWSPALLPLRQEPSFLAVFVVFAGATALEPLISNVFLARLNTRFIVKKNIIFGFLRIALLPIFAVLFSNAFGVFASQGLAMTFAVLAAVLWFLPRVQHAYRPLPKFDKRVVGELGHYAAGNYIARLLWQSPVFLMPLVVLNNLGAEMNAYFSVAWTAAIAFMVVPSSVFNSLFAEGANDQSSLRANTAKALKYTFLLLLPLTGTILIIAEPALLLLGQAYADNAAALLRIVVPASIPWGIIYLYISLERIRGNTKGIIAVTAACTSLSLALSYILMLQMGLIGAGVGYAAGQALAAVAVGIAIWRRYYSRVEGEDGAG